MVDNRCVVCGEIIPEGRQVCPTCEVMSNKETEELATEIYTLFRSRPMSRALARHLYDKGWRKQGEVVTDTNVGDEKYFTPEEVRKMTRAEVRANYTAIMNSMKKWNWKGGAE